MIVDFSEINSKIEFIVKVLEKNGIDFLYLPSYGHFGVLMFSLELYKIGIWVEPTDSLRLFFPNWAIFPLERYSEEFIFKIQSYNLNNTNNIYWLFNKEIGLALSSNSLLELDLRKANDFNNILDQIRLLIQSKFNFVSLIQNGDIKKTYSFKNKITEVIRAHLNCMLYECGCKRITRDSEGDLHFTYKEHPMFIRFLNKDVFKIYKHCGEFDFSNEANLTDPYFQRIQRFNMISPIQCTFYRPSGKIISLTMNTTIPSSQIEIGKGIRYQQLHLKLNQLYNISNDKDILNTLLLKDNSSQIFLTSKQPFILNTPKININ